MSFVKRASESVKKDAGFLAESVSAYAERRSRPQGVGYGDIHYGYHDYITDSEGAWNVAMNRMGTLDGFREEIWLGRCIFRAWKREAWWRIIRVRRGREAVKVWRRLAARTKANRGDNQVAERHWRKKAGKEAVGRWKRNVGKMEMKKCRDMEAKAVARFKRNKGKDAISVWKRWEDVERRKRDGKGRMEVWGRKVAIVRAWQGWKGVWGSLETQHEGRCTWVFKRLADNVEGRRGRRIRYEEAWDWNEVNMMKRGLRKMHRYARVKKDFRGRIRRALKGTENAWKGRAWWAWKGFIEGVWEEREGRIGAWKKGREIDKMRGTMCRLREGAVRIRRGRKAAEEGWRRRAKNALRRMKEKVREEERRVDAGVRFNKWKCRKGLWKWRGWVKQREAVKAFGSLRKGKSDVRLLRWIWGAWQGWLRRRKDRRENGTEVKKRREVRVVRGAMGRWFKKAKVEILYRERKEAWIRCVLRAWREMGKVGGVARRRLVKIAMRMWRRKLIRVVTIQGVAKKYFVTRCERLVARKVFDAIWVNKKRMKKGKAKIVGQYLKVLMREKLVAFNKWRFVAERVTWQNACLRVGMRRRTKKIFDTWRDNAEKFKRDRLLCEYADREGRRIRKERAVAKLFRYLVGRKRERRVMEKAKRWKWGRRAAEGMERWKNWEERRKDGKERSGRAKGYRREKGLVLGMGAWIEYKRRSKVGRVVRIAAAVMSDKHNVVKGFRAWKEESAKRVKLRAGVICGLGLMKALAWKRWRGGVVHVKLRRRWIRGVLYWWRGEARRRVEWGRERIKKRWFGRWAEGKEWRKRRRERDEVAWGEIVGKRMSEAFEEWGRSMKAEKFRRGKGVEMRMRKALNRMRRRGQEFSMVRSRLDEWMVKEERVKGVRCTASKVWRWCLGGAGLVRWQSRILDRGCQYEDGVPKWKGNIRTQLTHVAFAGIKIWVEERKKQARLNEKAIGFWFQRLERKAFTGWREVRAERIFEEENNEVALDFWYQRICKGVLREWKVRTVYFRDCREEAEEGMVKAGFGKFVRGCMERKIERMQRGGAEGMWVERRRRMGREVLMAWSDWTMWERKERNLREKREGERMIMEESLVRWRMWVRGAKLTRLVHLHHDKRFHEGVEKGVLAEVEKGMGL